MAIPRRKWSLWDALSGAGPDGISVADLEAACGRTRRWVYYRLQEHAAAGRAVQVRRGYWRAARPSDGRPRPGPKDSRPRGRPRRPGRPGLTVAVSEEMFVNEPRARAYARRATRAPCTFTFTITRRDRDARPGPQLPPAGRRHGRQ